MVNDTVRRTVFDACRPEWFRIAKENQCGGVAVFDACRPERFRISFTQPHNRQVVKCILCILKVNVYVLLRTKFETLARK